MKPNSTICKPVLLQLSVLGCCNVWDMVVAFLQELKISNISSAQAALSKWLLSHNKQLDVD
jgi:hypothetical protein